MDVRSYCSNRFATVHPLFTSPTTFCLGTRTLSKKVSQNGDSPLMSRMGFTETPGVLMSKRMKVMPSCFDALGSVRTRQNIQSALSAPEVQIFCPLIT